MGAKATKMEGEYLPDTPTLNKMRLASEKREQMEMTTPNREQNNALLDPRSPNGCRTPLTFLQASKPRVEEEEQHVTTSENAFSMLRKRLLKGFSLNDPRSPQLNRTPLVLDEVRSLNMDDTFADLFVDTRVGTAQRAVPASPPQVDLEESCDSFGTPPSAAHNNISLEIVSLPYDQEETLPCEQQLLPYQEPNLEQGQVKMATPPPEQQPHGDPRSPSLGVDRTPIIFCDDEEEEAREAQMLEHILETLTLNLSTGSSMASFVAGEEQLPEVPSNKHLERVRLGHKRRVPPRKPARANKPKIYVDQEEGSPVTGGSITPKTNSTPLSAQKRTPLSCVKNKPHLRSRSMEKDSKKNQIPPAQSFNDQLRIISGTEGFSGPVY
uniref:LD32040p n=1 Tax=Drosophila melanogaster TaxID=7227 RepID=Q9VIT3_DROME|eukprot:NP_609991.1 msb1l [Drosophila melanogaster]